MDLFCWPSRFLSLLLNLTCGFSFAEVLMARKNALLAQQRRNLRPEGALNHEVRLPQEWTY